MSDETNPAPRPAVVVEPNVTRAGNDPDATTAPTESQIRTEPARGVTEQRYVLGDEIAHGGMGAVHRATDTVLDREVAVKVLKSKFGLDSPAALRFADEARITAQLQHPNIPAVHDLGTLPDGRPFLAMKLIKGDTLDHQLTARGGAGDDLGRFVAVFEQICQALAYAHAHNVIHRDLKPANVMVGSYGEVQVMDWGLAKVLTGAGTSTTEADPFATAPVATEIRSLRDSDGTGTQAGSVLGTPAFMPPEQAVGATGKIGPRSDVFGLGAILAVVLTGKAPFAGGSAETTRIKAAQGNLQECFARLDACHAEPELIALCKKCLSPNPNDRPADAGAVAQAVAELRLAADERARRAEKNEAETRVRATEQRKRRRALTIAGFVLVGVLVAGMIGTTTGLVRAETARGAEAEQRKQAEQARDEADQQRREAERTRDALALSLKAEQAARQEADENYQLAREAVVGVAWDIPDVLREAMYARSAQEKVVTVLAEMMEKQLALASTRNLPDRAMHGILLKLGDLRYLQSKWNEAQKHYDDALAISARLLKTEARERDRAKVNHASSYRVLGFLEREGRNNMMLALEHFRAAEKLQREVVNAPTTGEVTPAEAKLYLSGSLFEIADVYERRQQFDDALKACEEVVSLRREVLKLPQTPNTRNAAGLLADACVLLGEIQFARGKNAEAESAMKEAVEIYRKEIERDPGNLYRQRQAARANRALGDLLLFLKRFDDAKPAHVADMTLSFGLLRINEIANAQTDLSRAHYRAATLALKQGDRAGAIELYKKCVTIRREVVVAQPDNDFAKMGLAAALARSGDHIGAMEVYAPLRRRFPRNISIVNQSAAILGICADAVLAGRKPAELNLLERWLYRAYLDEALGSLERLVTNWIYQDLANLETDPDLDPIRADPRFQKCVEVVKKRIADQKKP